MTDTEMKLSRFLNLLIQQTKAGKLSWRESYRNSYQLPLSRRTVVIRNDATSLYGPALEIRDSKGEVVEKIGSDITSDMMLNEPGTRTDSGLIEKVSELASLVGNMRVSRLNETLDDMLKELEK